MNNLDNSAGILAAFFYDVYKGLLLVVFSNSTYDNADMPGKASLPEPVSLSLPACTSGVAISLPSPVLLAQMSHPVFPGQLSAPYLAARI